MYLTLSHSTTCRIMRSTTYSSGALASLYDLDSPSLRFTLCLLHQLACLVRSSFGVERILTMVPMDVVGVIQWLKFRLRRGLTGLAIFQQSGTDPANVKTVSYTILFRGVLQQLLWVAVNLCKLAAGSHQLWPTASFQQCLTLHRFHSLLLLLWHNHSSV